VDRPLVPIKRRNEIVSHEWPLAIARLIAVRARHASAAGGGEGAAPASSTTNNVVSGTVGAQGAAAASQKAPGNATTPSSRDAAGTGGGEGRQPTRARKGKRNSKKAPRIWGGLRGAKLAGLER
jgi:hypothetical protein